MSNLLKRKAASLILIIAVAAAMLAMTETPSSAASGKYWIKVNKQKCVATVYKHSGGKWKPYRAMLCSVGKRSTPTPSGTFRLGGKFRWIRMVTEGVTTYEQYTTRFHGEYYLHSPCYAKPKKNRQKAHTYYTIGKHVTHGCIRFAVMDAKWIYENCARGTRVTIYSSSHAGPLGKPAPVKYVKKHGRAWDPTDPDKKNPVFRMRKPKFTINKATNVLYGKNYALRAGVKVMNTNAIQNLTGNMKITKLTRNSASMSIKKFSTRSLGEYRVTYYIKDKYCIKKGGKGTSQTFTFRVIDQSTISGVTNKALNQDDRANLLAGVSAKALSRDLTSTIKVTITKPDGSQRILSATEAKNFLFDQAGAYKVTYAVTNPYPKKVVSKVATYTVKAKEVAPEPQQPEQPEQKAQQPSTQKALKAAPEETAQPATDQGADQEPAAAESEETE